MDVYCTSLFTDLSQLHVFHTFACNLWLDFHVILPYTQCMTIHLVIWLSRVGYRMCFIVIAWDNYYLSCRR